MDPAQDDQPGFQGPIRAQEMERVADSVTRELRSLLNTRLPSAVGFSDESVQSVVNYGLPDFLLLNSAGAVDRERLARLIETKVTAFEPRLRHVRVALEAHPVDRAAVTGTMEAILQIESIGEPISFPLSIGSAGVLLAQASDAG